MEGPTRPASKSKSLEISEEPKIAAALFEVGIPAADGIGDGDDGEPDEVHGGQTEPVVRREKLARAADRGRRQQQEMVWAKAQHAQSDGGQVGKSKVEEKEKEGDATENDDRIVG